MKKNEDLLRHLNKRKSPFTTGFFGVVGAVFVVIGTLVYLWFLPMPQVIEVYAPQQGQATLDSPVFEEIAPPEVVTPTVSGREYEGLFDLPLVGATGWAGTHSVLRATPDIAGEVTHQLASGTPFVVEYALDGFWYVSLTDGDSGYIPSGRALINLPDILPSLLFYISNATNSVFRSGGWSLPALTGEQLYIAHGYNPRLGREEFIVPTLYQTARRMAVAHRAAMEVGDIIIVYEIFRPAYTQFQVVDAMNELVASNAGARANINSGGWHVGWFISQNISHHQRGAAADVHLGRILDVETQQVGAYSFPRVTAFEYYHMVSHIHELSPAAAIMNSPTQNIVVPHRVTQGGLRLFHYMVDVAGFAPLASEWWHFDDVAGNVSATQIGMQGDFFTPSVYSRVP